MNLLERSEIADILVSSGIQLFKLREMVCVLFKSLRHN